MFRYRVHGELRVIIGPNGAGKTTFCDLVSGKTAPTTGSVFYDGRNITKMDESDIALMGIGRKFQTPTVFDSLTTYENLLLALPGAQDWKNNLWTRESAEERAQIESILHKVNLMEYRDLEAKSLSHGKRQWLAISALIVSKPKLFGGRARGGSHPIWRPNRLLICCSNWLRNTPWW